MVVRQIPASYRRSGRADRDRTESRGRQVEERRLRFRLIRKSSITPEPPKCSSSAELKAPVSKNLTSSAEFLGNRPIARIPDVGEAKAEDAEARRRRWKRLAEPGQPRRRLSMREVPAATPAARLL